METLPADYNANVLVAGYLSGPAPTLDGSVDGVWANARTVELSAFGGSGNFPLGSGIKVRALNDLTNLYLLVQWPDATRDYSMGAWELNDNSTAGGAWTQHTWGDDSLTILWTDQRASDATTFVDAWTWSASLTDPMGFADDLHLDNVTIINASLAGGLVGDGPTPWVENNVSTVYGPRPQYWNGSVAPPTSAEHIADADKMDFAWPAANSTSYPVGWRVPGWVLSDPGAVPRGEVRAAASHNGTGWTLELERALTTADAGAGDVDMGNALTQYNFAMALTNNQTANNQSSTGYSNRMILAEFDAPNLRVGNIVATDRSPLIGVDANLSVSVLNDGFADGTVPTLLSVWDDAAAAEVANVSVPPAAWGGSSLVTVTFPTSSYSSGLRNFTLTADSMDAEAEIFENDNSASLQLFFTSNPADPDLVFDAIQGPASPVFAGSSFRINGTIHNIGPGDAGPAIYVRAAHALFTASEEDLGFLFANQTANFSLLVSSAGVPAGSYNLSVEIDPFDNITEVSKANNLAAGPVAIETRPDLAISNITAAPAAFPPGSTSNLTVNVTNRGAPAAGTARVWMYLDDLNSTGATGRVLDWQFDFDLGNGESVATSADWITSSLIGEGSHTLRAWVDPTRLVTEVSDSNNNGSAPIVVLPPARPDLTILNATTDAASYRVGEQGNATVVVANLGINYTGDVTLQLLEATLNRSLATVTVAPVPAGENRTVVVGFTAPSGGSGVHAMQLLIDSDNVIDEAPFELNNAFGLSYTLLPAPAPDLVVTSVTFSPTSVTRGSTVEITATVANNGNGPAAACQVGFFFGLNEIGRAALPALQPQGTTSVTFGWSTENVTGRLALLGAQADVGAAVAESDESNNQLQATLSVRDPGVAQFQLGSIRVEPAEAQNGTTVRIEVGVRNAGNGSGEAALRLKVDGVTIGLINFSLAAGENTTVRANVTAGAAGNHSVRAELEVAGLGVDQVVSSYRVPAQPVAPPPSWGTALAVVFLGAAAAVAFLLLRRGRPPAEEPSPPPEAAAAAPSKERAPAGEPEPPPQPESPPEN